MRTALAAMLCLTCSSLIGCGAMSDSSDFANVLENSSFEIGSGNSAAA